MSPPASVQYAAGVDLTVGRREEAELQTQAGL